VGIAVMIPASGFIWGPYVLYFKERWIEGKTGEELSMSNLP
jgi:hypothetical protein